MSSAGGPLETPESEAPYRAFFEHARDAILLTDDSGRYVDANPAACALLGYSRQELRRLTVWDVTTPENADETHALWHEITSVGHASGECDLVRKDGTQVSVEFNTVANVLPGLHFTISRDLTERRRAAELLRASEQKYQSIIANAPLVLYMIDSTGHFTLSEGRGLEAVERRPDIIGQSAWELYGHLEVRETSGHVSTGREVLERVLRGESVTGVLELNGRYLENSFIPLRTSDGAIDGVMGVAFDVTDLQRSLDALRRTEEHVRAVLENISDVITVLAPDATILYGSPSVTTVLGFDPAELVGHSAFEFVHPDDVATLARAFAASRADIVREQFRFRRKNGAWLTLEAVGRAYGAEDGTRTVVVASRDVSERERAVAESRLLQDITLRVAEARDTDGVLASVMRLVCDTIGWAYAEAWVPSADGLHLEPSRIWYSAGTELETLRRASEGLRFASGVGLPGRAWAIREPVWVADLSADGAFSRQDVAVAAGLRTALALPIAADDGSAGVIAVMVFYAVHPQEEDTRLTNLLTAVMAQLGTAMQRKQAEGALRSSQKLLQSVVTSAPVIVFALNRDGVFTLSEGRGLEPLGLRPGQVVGTSALDLYANVPDVTAHLRRALKGEMFIGAADVAGRSYQTWYSPIIDPGGAVSGVVGVATDITERKQLEEQLRQSQKLESVGRLAGGIAHDFNNMLTAINGYAELIMGRLPETDPMREEVVDIQRAAEKASLLTYQLLAFSRKQILRPKTLNLNDVVSDVSKMLQRLIGEDIAIVARLEADLDPVSADPGQVAQVLMNLSVNARDAMPDGGVLTLETANVDLDADYAAAHLGVQPGRYVMLAVSDTGIGMSPDIQRRIFEPFFTTKPVGKGTGMGLATVHGIVNQSGGSLWVYSEVGHGSTFKIYLPRAAEPAARVDSAPPEVTLARGVETILLVEDEDMVRRLVRRTLEGCGYHILEAADGAAALDICGDSTPIALLITDVVMPKMSGRELAGRLSASRPDLRVLFMSGYTDTAVTQHGVLDDATDFLQKPFTIQTLAEKVREVLDR